MCHVATNKVLCFFHHVSTGLVFTQPAGFVLGQFLSSVAHRRPAAARFLGRVHQTLAVCGPGAWGVKDLPRFHPADLPIGQQVTHEVLPLHRGASVKILEDVSIILDLHCDVQVCMLKKS